jgi:ATPase subunit of ABC transporter with duplicated ATPase domains
MMMYGGGNILLKNATLDLRRGHRYGVVGRNGAGKTTLMSMIANGGVTQIPSNIKTLHVRPEVLVEASELNATQFCKRDSPDASDQQLQDALNEVGFPKDMQVKSVNELSGGWRMKLLLASAMMRHCDILLLDEPTNHLDKESVAWLSRYLVSLARSTLMVISHDPYFLNEVCTDIIQYSAQRTLEYYPGNFADFREAKKLTDQDSEALLLGNEVDLGETPDIPADEVDSGLALTAAALDKQAKITFPIPGKLQGHSAAKAVVEMKDVCFAYNEEEGPLILKSISCKVTLSSRIGIVGANGAGKSTLLNLICGELSPSPGPGGATPGEVSRHRNLRLAYIAQQHMYHLGEFMNSSPYIYIQRRFKEGYDEALQRRLIDPANEEEAKLREERAKRWGKYGREVDTVIGRVVRGSEVVYEVQWKGLDDPKQNTWETIAKLKNLGVVSMARAYDERMAAQAAGCDTRPLSQKEIVKHLVSFGLNEDQVLNQNVGSFSAGQKSKLTLGAAFWTKPHVVALDEPTNYIDMETLDALAKALQRFKGGMVVISHSSEFVDRVCSELWLVEGGTIASVTKQETGK